MHAVLDHEADGTNAQQDQALKQGLGQTRSAGRGEEMGEKAEWRERDGGGESVELSAGVCTYLDAFLHITTGPS